ncbi:MAG: T9SS type A sorting domain-containing protein, partial [Bacteroidota bacterium]
KFIIPDTKSLTVTGNLTNYGGNAGLVINSSASGTGCLIHNSGDVPGTVNRYFTGSAESWHLISSPVYGQTITGDFTPTGSYGDGTGYDLYAWYESSGVWVNYKNSTVSPTWTLVNGNNNFAPIRGYLASYQAANPTKAFAGLMNSGAVSISLSKFGTGTYAGYNLFGNPYPSPIDWKASGGWIRSYLVNNGGGYDISIWNNTDGNYGVYNSASISDNGTHGATRYIPVGQGFFVKASAGAQPFGMDNDVRVSQNPAFLKSSEELSNVLRLRVTGTANTYSDEAIIEFGHENATGGGTKLFSMYTTAPSLYITKAGEDYSIDFRGEPASMNIPLNFIAGVDGSYTLTASQFETFSQGTVITVEDLKELRTQVLTQNPVYTYNALTTDDHTRFVLHFGGTFSTGDIKDQNPLNLYTSGNKVYIAGTSGQALSGDVFVYNLMGQQLHQQKLSGGSLSEISLNVSTGYYIVKMVTDRQTLTSKVFIK